MDEERSTAEATLREFLNEGGKLHLHVLLSVAQALKHDAKLQLQEPHSEASPLGSIVVGQNVQSRKVSHSRFHLLDLGESPLPQARPMPLLPDT